MECIKCRTPNPEGKKYCGDCGTPLDLSLGPLKNLLESTVREQIQSALKEYFKDQKAAEFDITERVTNRLIGWAKILGGVLGVVLLILGAVGIKSFSDVTGDAKKQIDSQVEQKKEEIGKLVKEANTGASEIKQARDTAQQVNQETQGLRSSMQEIDRSVRNNRDNIMKDVTTAHGYVLELQSSRGQAEASIKEIEQSRKEARRLLIQFGQDPSATAGFGPDQTERLIETKLLKSLQNVLPADEYTRLKAALKPAAVAGELHREIYDAENHTVLPGKLVRSEGQPPTNDPVVTQVYDNIETVYKFFLDSFGRNIGDTGGIVRATVHYDQNYDNAFWDGSRLVFGDGDGVLFKTHSFASLSTVTRELSEPVIASSTGLAYHGESGALITHLSDVFSALVEQWHQNQTVDKASWLIGSDLLAQGVKGVALRSMKAPGTAYDDPRLGKDPQPDHMNKFVKTTDDNGGVHINSGIPNRAFYEVAKAIGGHAWEHAGTIWYISMTQRLQPNSTFKDFARATYEVAGQLYGSGSPEQEAVRKGWQVVGITVGDGQKS